MEDDILQILGHFGGNGEEPSDSDEEHPPGGGESGDDESGDEEAQSRPSASDINFDKSLPGAHSYLGSDLEDVGGRTIHDDDSVVSVPLLWLPGVVLCPGQTLPLQLYQPHLVAMMQRVVEQDKTFGLVTSRHYGEDASLAAVGTTAEVLAYKVEEDEGSGVRTLRVKAIGRQRFRVCGSRRQIDGVVTARVAILPEHVLADPLRGVRPAGEARLPPHSAEGGQHKAVPRANNRHKVDRLTSANLTHWPPWVYKQYDVHDLMRRVREELVSWNESLTPAMMPPDPADFSHWVTANLPLDDALRLRLLAVNSAVQRLRALLSIIKRCTALCCRECNALVAHKSDVFSMALEGPMAAYVNPGGYVHETLTVHKAHNLALSGRPSTQNSWFPGYAWTIVQCRACQQHLGWRFTAARRHLKPAKFWGLTRSGLLPGLQPGADDSDDDWQPVM